MIDDFELGAVELARQQFFGQRETHRVGETLPEWAGGRLDAGRVLALGVTGRHRMELAEVLSCSIGRS